MDFRNGFSNSRSHLIAQIYCSIDCYAIIIVERTSVISVILHSSWYAALHCNYYYYQLHFTFFIHIFQCVNVSLIPPMPSSFFTSCCRWAWNPIYSLLMDYNGRAMEISFSSQLKCQLPHHFHCIQSHFDCYSYWHVSWTISNEGIFTLTIARAFWTCTITNIINSSTDFVLCKIYIYPFDITWKLVNPNHIWINFLIFIVQS